MDTSHKYIINKEQKWVYYEVQKNATRSILKALVPKYGQRVFKLPDVKGYFKFSFVRNPWHRLVSCYLSKIKYYGQTGYTIPAAERGLLGIRDKRLNKDMSFKEFVDFVVSIPHNKADVHFAPQYMFIPEDVNFVGRVEDLPRDFKQVTKRLGIEVDLPYVNQSPSKNWQWFYNEELKRKVEAYYKMDIVRFGYKFN